jgi:hypothetical protein
MVEIRYLGRLGNRLFMYAAGRIIAEEMGYELRAEPIDGFEGTKEPVPGERHHGPVQMLSPRDHLKVADIVADRSRRKIVLKSYMQDYENFKNRASDVKKWFRLPKGDVADPDAVVIQVRLGDFVRLGWAVSMDYYTQILEERFARKKVIIMTDEPGHPSLARLRKYGTSHFKGTATEQMAFSATARNLIIGTSTFSWWSAFLSGANVFAPLLKRGYYSFRPFKNGNYIVNEERYTYIQGVETMDAGGA